MLAPSGQARRGETFRTPPGSKDSNGKDLPQGAADPLPGFCTARTALLTSNLLWDNCPMPRWLTALLITCLGVVAGLSYGLFLSPVEYVDTTPASLRIDFRTDYVLMVAERFHADRDQAGALRRISILATGSPASMCAEALTFARTSSYSAHDVGLLEELNRAMQALSPALTPTVVPS